MTPEQIGQAVPLLEQMDEAISAKRTLADATHVDAYGRPTLLVGADGRRQVTPIWDDEVRLAVLSLLRTRAQARLLIIRADLRELGVELPQEPPHA